MVLFYTHTKFLKNRRDRGGFDLLNAHGMTLRPKTYVEMPHFVKFTPKFDYEFR